MKKKITALLLSASILGCAEDNGTYAKQSMQDCYNFDNVPNGTLIVFGDKDFIYKYCELDTVIIVSKGEISCIKGDKRTELLDGK